MRSSDWSDRLLILVLAATAGCVDAVGFIELGGYFVSFMSGNTTRLGLAAGEGDWSGAGFVLGLIMLFVGGVTAGHLIGRGAGAARITTLLGVEAMLLAIAAILHDLGLARIASPLTAVAMGFANSIFSRDGGQGVGVTYMTGALVRIGAAIAQGRRRDLALDLMLWLSLTIGVALGAIGHHALGGGILRLPAAALLFAAIVIWWRGRGTRASSS